MKRIFFVLTAVCFLILLVVCLYVAFSNLPEGSGIPFGQEDNGTEGGWKLPDIRFPWSPPKKTSNNSGGGGSAEGSEMGGASGSNQTMLPAGNFTLSINSTHDLNVSVIYTVSGSEYNVTQSLPLFLEVQKNSRVCISETTGSGTIRWLLDSGEDCPFSDCGGTLYDCDILMDRNVSMTLRQYS